jgi:hypothetical protein
MSERFNEVLNEEGGESPWADAFSDANLGFAELPAEIKIESDADIARFKSEHGIDFSDFIERQS